MIDIIDQNSKLAEQLHHHHHHQEKEEINLDCNNQTITNDSKPGKS